MPNIHLLDYPAENNSEINPTVTRYGAKYMQGSFIRIQLSSMSVHVCSRYNLLLRDFFMTIILLPAESGPKMI